MRIFNTNVKSILLYACKTWKTTNQMTRRLQIFVNKCLRRKTNIKWTDKITNEELWRINQQKSKENQIIRRKWNWIGHTLREEAGAIEKTALVWNPQGCRRRGGPKRTCRRTIEDDIRSTRRSWNEVKGIAGDHNSWKPFMDALCSTRSKRTWWWSHKMHDFSKKTFTEYKICFDFFYKFVWNISHSKNNWARCDHKCELVFMFTRCSCRVLILSNIFRKNSQISNFMKIRPEGAEMFHEDGRTHRRTES